MELGNKEMMLVTQNISDSIHSCFGGLALIMRYYCNRCACA